MPAESGESQMQHDHTDTVDRASRQEAYDQAALLRYYEQTMYDPLIREFTGGSDFHNFGYWDTQTGNHRQACENLMEKLLGLLPQPVGTILDVACGKGATTKFLLRHYRPAAITAIDLSAKLLATARANAPGCTFLPMDAGRLAFREATFDTVIYVEAASHFTSRDEFLGEVRRVIKPGGWLLLTDTLISTAAAQRRIGRTLASQVDTPAAYRACLRRAGFGQITVVDATGPCWQGLYWGAVRFAHGKLLAQEIDLPALERFLEPTYQRVPDLEYYLLAAAQKSLKE